MDNNEIFEKVKEVFVEEFELDEADISLESTIFDDLGLDSLDSVDLIVALEKAFDFRIDRENDAPVISQIRIVKDIMNYIESKKDAKG